MFIQVIMPMWTEKDSAPIGILGKDTGDRAQALIDIGSSMVELRNVFFSHLHCYGFSKQENTQ